MKSRAIRADAVDRTAIRVQSLHEEPDDKRWWWSRSINERLAAIELMRRTIYGRAAAHGRLQRVLECAQRTALTWVRATPENAVRVLAAVREFGFDTPELNPALFSDPLSIVRFGIPPFRIEVMTSIDGVEFEPCLARALSCDLDGVTVPVISLADLKVNKRAAGRHKDLADLDNLP